MKLEGTKLVTNKVRFSYAHVDKPASIEEGQAKKYSVSILIDKDDQQLVDGIEKAIKAAREAGKAKLGKVVESKFWNPLRDGDDEKPDDDNYANCYFINAKSDRRPDVIDRTGKIIISDDNFEELTRNRTDKEVEELHAKRSSEEFYSGCYGAASVNFYAFAASGSKGVACGLNSLIKLADGDSLGGGRSSAAEDFGDLMDEDFMQ